MLSRHSIIMREIYSRTELNHTVWDMPDYYENLVTIGVGTFGTVVLVEFSVRASGLKI